MDEHGKRAQATPMSDLKPQIIQQLPYLRRYARSLTGSQAQGDALIRSCLESLLSAPERLAGKAKLLVRLFRLFHQGLGDLAPSVQGAPGDPMQRRVDERLADLALGDRQALLLVHQEGFSPAEAAEILGVERAEIEHRIDQAWAALKSQPPTDVLIIEDE